MPAKKVKKPSQSIRYLLFADRRLQRISLRKISERIKGRKPVSRTRRAAGRTRTPKPILPSLAIGPGAIVLGLAFAVGAAVLIGARQAAPVASGENAAASSMDAPLVVEKNSAPTMAAPVALEKPTVRKMDAPIERAPTVRQAEPRVRPEPTRKSPATNVATPAASSAPAAHLTPIPAEPARTATPAPAVTVENPPAHADDEEGPAVTTISGCLGSDGDTFRLKDTSGSDVPKARSWKSGFLKKRSVGITVVDAGRTLHLASYVGQRVAATGTLVDRELRARSVRRLAAGCE